MIEPINARRLISNGWNIKNRRFLQQRIGKDECARLYDAFSRIQVAGNAIPSFTGSYDKLILKSGIPTLVTKKNDIKLFLNIAIENMKTKFKHPLVFFNEDITTENIEQAVTNLERGARKSYNISYPEAELESETLKTLFSPKFAPKRRRDSKGYAVTTVIDNQTQKPVEVYVKCINKTPKNESWGIYTKEDDEYKEIGYRSFKIDRTQEAINPGYIESYNDNKKYSGIGIRLHQISIERMIQNGFDRMFIESTPEAFPFHYKSGFRLVKSFIPFSEDSLNSYINIWSKKIGLPKDVLEKEVISSKIGDLICLDNITIENFMLKGIKNNKKITTAKKDEVPEIINMTLSKDWLNTWKTMAQLQPILL